MYSFFHIVQPEPSDMLNGLNLENPTDALGFLACAPDSNYNDLLSELAHSMPIPCIGGTSVGDPFDVSGEPFGTNLSFFGKKDVRHSVVLSDALDKQHAREQMNDMYRRCVDGLRGEPKLFLAILPVVPNLFIDDFMDELLGLAGDVPVFGGMVSDDDLSVHRFAVFSGGVSYQERMVLAAFTGGIRPSFGIGCELTVLSDYSPAITEASENAILRVDDVPFGDYIAKLGFTAESLDDFPLSIRMRDPEAGPDELPEINALIRIEENSGRGIFSNTVRQGHRISVGCLTRDNIVHSTQTCLDSLIRNMTDAAMEGYRHDVILCVSCIARYYTMAGGERVEAKLLEQRLPEELPKFGYYGFSEICPSPGRDGNPRNRNHGQAIIMCSF